MDIQTAVQNLDNLIATSRLTRQDHVALQQSLQYLEAEAKKSADKKEEA